MLKSITTKCRHLDKEVEKIVIFGEPGILFKKNSGEKQNSPIYIRCNMDYTSDVYPSDIWISRMVFATRNPP